MPSFPLILRTSSKKTSRCNSLSPKLSLFVKRRTFYSLGILAAGVGVGVRHGRESLFVPHRIISRTHKLYHYASTHFTSLHNLASFSRRNLFLSTSPDMSHISTLKLPQEPLKWTHTPEELISLTKEQIEEDRTFLNKIGALPEAECNFETVSRRFCLQYRPTDSPRYVQVFVRRVTHSVVFPNMLSACSCRTGHIFQPYRGTFDIL